VQVVPGSGTTSILNINGGTVSLQMQGTKVLGPQGAAVADAVATVASVQTQLNLLLARVRAATGHGLIA
jgi:hypothetical protein